MDGFSYSKANKEKAVHWEEATLYDYLLAPKKYIPGIVLQFASGCSSGSSHTLVSVHHLAASICPPMLVGICRFV